MRENEPVVVIARAKRVGYAVQAVITLALSAFPAAMIRVGLRNDGPGGGGDWLFHLLFFTLFGIAAAVVALTGPKAIYPPELRADGDGFILRAGFRVRRWPWAVIPDFRVEGVRTPYVSFMWSDARTGRLRSEWLAYPFAGTTVDLLAALNAKLAAAREAGLGPPADPGTDPEAVRQDDERWQRRNRQMGYALSAFGAFVLLALLSEWTSGTVLLTPIDPGIHHVMIGAGACVGSLLPITLLLASTARRLRRPPLRACLGILVLFGPIFVLTGAFAGAAAAWRVATVTIFTGSTAPFERQYYLVQHLREGKGSATDAEIDPFNTGETTSLPVSYGEYERLNTLGRTDERARLCYPVLAQREGDAVRIIRPMRHSVIEVLVRCPAGAR